jgi:hypothetical protein
MLACLLALLAGGRVGALPGSAFVGNSSASNHFTLLATGPRAVLVGGRDVLYSLSLPGLQEEVEEVRGSVV